MATSRKPRRRPIPSCVQIWRIYAEAKASVPGRYDSELSQQQAYLRRVSVVFHKRLKAAGIHVEGGL